MEATSQESSASALEGQEAQGETVSEAPKPERYKLKVNGKEVEKTIDELIRDAQKGVAADEKFQQAASLAKKYSAYEQMEKAIQSGQIGPLIEKLGHDKFRQFAENYLIDYLEYEQLPPEKKEALQYRRQLEAAQRQLQEIEASKREAEMSQHKAQALAEIDQEIADVLKSAGKRPTPYLVARIAEQMLASLQSREDADPRSIAKSAYSRAVKSIENDVSEYLGNLTVDDARRVLPKQLLDALRKSEVELVKSQDPMRSRQTAKTERAPRKGEKVRMSTDDFFKQRIEKNLGA